MLPTEFDPENSVLFLGSGFSSEATNIAGGRVPTGSELKQQVAALVGESGDNYDLRVLSEAAASEDRTKSMLYSLLYNSYTIRSVTDEISWIATQSWLRVYTTNYDDSVELARNKSKIDTQSFSYDDSKPKKLPANSIIHLHGRIHQLTPENILEQLVLTERSYVRQHFEKSTWYDEFSRDIRFASSIYFVGYSLSDYHISALLMQSSALAQKTFFVRQVGDDRFFDGRVSPYGKIVPIGTQGFAADSRMRARAARLTDPTTLKSFRLVDPFKDKRTIAPPTAIEVLNLLAFGAFSHPRSVGAGGTGGNYVVTRKAAVVAAASLLETSRCLLLHSRLGNGKTIFVQLLATALSEKLQRVFLYRAGNPNIQKEIELLALQDKVTIIIDSYTEAQDVIGHLSNSLPNAKFIITVRTGVYDVRLHEIDRELPRPLSRQSINTLSSDDIKELKDVCRKAGLGANDVSVIDRTGRELRDILLRLFRSTQIRNAIDKVFEPVLRSSETRKMLIAMLLIDFIGETADPAFIRTVTGIDIYEEVGRHAEVLGEVLYWNKSEDAVFVRSSVFAEFAIQKFLTAGEVLGVVFELVIASGERKAERGYRVIFSGLMQFATLNKLLLEKERSLEEIGKLYERFRRHPMINEEPLFWLQYSILMVERDELQAADEFVSTAYSRAREMVGFRTYQIDTHAFRVVVSIETRAVGTVVERFDEISDRLADVARMIDEEAHRYYAIRVLEYIEPFVNARHSSLKMAERNVLVLWLNRLAQGLSRLPVDVRAQSGSDQVLLSLERTKNTLLQ